MRVLGAVLAGGRSSRFGSDKCDFVIGDQRLLDRAVASLARQVNQVAVCGRAEPSRLCLADRPDAGLGPLGGLSAALHHAATNGFDAVLTAPSDVLPLPADLLSYLAPPGPLHLLRQHAVGCWPVRLAPDLDLFIAQGNRSMKSWIAQCGSQPVDDADLRLCNLNSPGELGEVLSRLASGSAADQS